MNKFYAIGEVVINPAMIAYAHVDILGRVTIYLSGVVLDGSPATLEFHDETENDQAIAMLATLCGAE